MVALGYIEPLAEDANQAVRQTVRELRINLAGSYMDGGLLKKAAEMYQELWEEWPEEHRLGISLAGCLAGLGKIEERRGVLDRLKENMRRFAESAAADLERYLEEHGEPKAPDLSEVEKYRLRRLAYLATPDTGAVAFPEGLQQSLEGRPDAAVAELERGVEEAPRRRRCTSGSGTR